MIVVHHLNDSRSQRILWLLEELGLPYELVAHQRDPKTLQAPSELLAVHPLGKAPVLVEDGQAIVESGAIVEHLLDRHGQGRLVPVAGTPEHARCRHWLHFAEGSAMAPLTVLMLAHGIKSAPMPMLARPIAKQIADAVVRTTADPELARQLAWMEAGLAEGPWFAGAQFSVADIMMSFPVQAAKALAGIEGHPRLVDWLARIEARPAWLASVARGGAYDLRLEA